MASFMVHIDKENETPAALAHKGPVKAFGPRKGKLNLQTPRKALFDVNNEQQLGKAPRGKDSSTYGPIKNPGKTKCDIFQDFENQNSNKSIKKAQPKKESTQKIHKKIERPQVLTKATVVTKKQPVQKLKPVKKFEADEEWDAIFPRQERLSTYVDKLFSWRPPCLFGELPESDVSDLDVSEQEDDFDFEMNLDPLDVQGFPENATMSDLVVPLPEWDSSDSSQAKSSDDLLNAPSALSLKPSPESSPKNFLFKDPTQL